MTRFPCGKKFAFSLFDDTDASTLDSVAPVYRLLSRLGIRVTKSVWALPNTAGAAYPGATLQDRDYLEFVRELKQQGFEIGLHNVQNSDATREVIQLGMEVFREHLGEYPTVHANHLFNRDNIYWGAERLSSSAIRLCYNVATRFRQHNFFRGHVEDSPYFWGDLCKQRIRYVRNFVFNEINLDRVNPTMPYHDPQKPYVNYWFSSCEGGNVEHFCSLLSEANQDRLEAEGGVCVMYTHFGIGFAENGVVHPRFEQLMTRLAAKNGWFVPVTTLLDHLRQQRRDSRIPPAELASIERHWIGYKMRIGPS